MELISYTGNCLSFLLNQPHFEFKYNQIKSDPCLRYFKLCSIIRARTSYVFLNVEIAVKVKSRCWLEIQLRMTSLPIILIHTMSIESHTIIFHKFKEKVLKWAPIFFTSVFGKSVTYFNIFNTIYIVWILSYNFLI